MADNFPGKIWIGGEIPPEVAKGLIRALAEDDACAVDYGRDSIKDDGNLQQLLAALDDGNLVFYNDQAEYGEFPATEAFCRQWGIDYDRHSDHYCEHDAERASFRKGMGTPVIIFTDSTNNEKVDGEKVREAMELLHRGIYGDTAESSKKVALNRALNILQSVCPEEPAPLPDVKIT